LPEFALDPANYMTEKRPDKPRSEMPTWIGPGAAVSSSSDDLSFSRDASASPSPSTSAGPGIPLSKAAGDDTALEPGTVLAQRYEILEILGQGGMGAVYKASDRELDRLVALKVIRTELARNPAIVDRFKQELRLSHRVTHRNVIRMYDLGEDAGVKFITMEFVEGRDLSSLIRTKGKFSPEETVEILQQICLALEAAHAVGILHRDLKPQNIMIDGTGRVLVMDFGLARTLDGNGMTQTGAFVGTMEYMSPEQALGKNLDQRSDLFALGLICYEMLTGKMPFQADSALASLIKRTQERAEPVTSYDPSIPATLSGIVSKCLESDAQLRYASAAAILEDLKTWKGKRAASNLKFHADVQSSGLNGLWIAIAVGILVIALGVTGFFVGKRLFGPKATQSVAGTPISLAIMPFYNASVDPSLDWLGSSLSDMLSSDIGQSKQVRMVSPDRLHQVLQDLRISGRSQVDVATLKRLAEFANADTVIFGQFVRAGDQIRIDTTILDLTHDSRVELKTDVPNEKELLGSVDKLASDIRERLAANPEALKELKAHVQRPSTTSIEALRAYDNGLQLARQGNKLDALKQFEAATTDDPNFALAFSKLGETYSDLGHDDLAEKASRRAVELSDSLPAQEKYLIDASHARITKDIPKAIAAYESLAKENLEDTDVQFALARLYEQASNFTAARQHLANVLSRDPKNAEALLASGRVEIKADNPQGGLDFLTRALNLAIQLDNLEVKAAILQASGIAYGMLNKPDYALNNYEESLAIKKQIGDKRGLAASLEEIASIQDSTGHPDAALASYKEALATRQEIGDKEGIGNTLIDTGAFYHDHGKPDEALKFFTDALQIERDLGDESKQSLCLNNIGSIRSDMGNYQDALTYLEQAYQLRQKLNVPEDMAESLHNLAETNTKLGQYDKALEQYLKAIEIRRGINDQRGVALESDSMAVIFAAQGRYGAALSAMQDALKIFKQTKEMTYFTAEITGRWGDLLAQVGRGDEGRQSIEEALNIANQIKNDTAASMATNWIGDVSFYKGYFDAARQQYDRAFQIASKTSQREQILVSKVNKAKTDVIQGHGSNSVAALKKLAQDADSLGLKSVSVECSVNLSAAMIEAKDYNGARQQLDLSLARAEKLGLRILQAKTHYLLASLLVKTGKSKEATPHYREVVRILETISKEDGAGRLLERADLLGMYRESIKSFQGGSQ
jgi:serine/threonine protein kinase/tetratricopeptide (TPR) repeat protein